MAVEVEVLVEVARGSRNKYEVDTNGVVRFDRRLPAALAFPADYGYVPGTVGSDGEPLDALVLMPEPTFPGVRISGRVIGVFWLVTGHGREAKLVVVPRGEPAYADITDLAQLPIHQLAEIRHFFDVYRDLDPNHSVRVDRQDGAEVAGQVFAQSVTAG